MHVSCRCDAGLNCPVLSLYKDSTVRLILFSVVVISLLLSPQHSQRPIRDPSILTMLRLAIFTILFATFMAAIYGLPCDDVPTVSKPTFHSELKLKRLLSFYYQSIHPTSITKSTSEPITPTTSPSVTASPGCGFSNHTHWNCPMVSATSLALI